MTAHRAETSRRVEMEKQIFCTKQKQEILGVARFKHG